MFDTPTKPLVTRLKFLLARAADYNLSWRTEKWYETERQLGSDKIASKEGGGCVCV